MKLFRSVSWRGWAVVTLALALSQETRASLIVLSTPDAPLPATSGNGLLGDYYRPTGGFQPGTIANAGAYIVSHTADATFVSTGVDYAAGSTYGSGNSVGDGDSVSTYLGSDASSLAALPGSPSGETTSQILANTLDGTMYVFSGFLAVTAAEVNTSQSFFLGSDDGSELDIQGQQVAINDGDHSFSFTGANTVEFTQSGLYAIKLLYYEDGGESGVELGSTLAGSGTFGQELTAANFYQSAPATTSAPEPSSLMLTGIGVAVAGGFFRKSRQRTIRA